MAASTTLAEGIAPIRVDTHPNLRSSAAILLLGLVVKGLLFWFYPALYGGDTVLHLRNHQHLFLGHQPPLLQILIFATHSLTPAPVAFRFVLIAIGALAGLGFYLLCLKWFNREAAFWAALFFITNPFLNEIAIVPFQECLMLGLLCFSVYFYLQKRLFAAAFMLGLACLTRYEAWIACPLLLLDHFVISNWRWRQLLRGVCLFCWAPMLWIGFHGGFSSPGTYVVEWPYSAARFVRWIYLGWIGAKYTPVPVIAMALLGLAIIHRGLFWRRRRVVLLSCFLILFLIAVLCSAHGVRHANSADRDRYVTSREATLPVGYLLLLSALGFESLLLHQRWRALAIPIGFAAVAIGILQSALFLDKETSQPDVALSYRLAQYMDVHARSFERVLILAKPFDDEEVRPILKKAEQLEGQRGVAGVRSVLHAVDLSPLNFQRTAVQMNLPERQILSSGNPATMQWIAIWSDYVSKEEVEGGLQAFHNVAELDADDLRVSIWRHL